MTKPGLIQDKKPEALKQTLLNLMVCVPITWADSTVIEFAEREAPCGTRHGWHFREIMGYDDLDRPVDEFGDPIRQSCDQHPEFVHVVLNA